MPSRTHRYHAELDWEGNTGQGTAGYADYGRAFRARIAGKPDLCGSADAAFLGEPDLHNPEDLLLIALSACHMLTYLALCARAGIRVLDYRDRPDAVLAFDAAGGGAFREATLRPQVTIAADGRLAQAQRLHEDAHRACFIARSCAFPVSQLVDVREAAGADA
jgi:organic hydroperoxide reductase OsmC/OhrA